MYYKIKKGSDLFNSIRAFWDKIKLVRSEARKITKEVNLGKSYCESTGFHDLAGGLVAFECLGDKPNDFKWWDKSRKLVEPKKANKELINRMNNLPVVKEKEMQELIKYTPKDIPVKNGRGSFRVNSIYNLTPCINDSLFLVKIPEGVPYEPIKGMEEIFYSEYQKLSKTNV